MNPSKGKWEGLRAVVVVRQSSDKEGTASTAAQLDFMHKEFQRVGMRYVDKEVLEGVPGSAPARITEVLEKLIRRKKKADDFDVIAWMVEDRASRGGGEHGMWLEHEAKRHGLRVFFAGDEYDAVPYAPVVRVAKYEAAKDSSVGNGRRSAQGQSWAQRQGFFRTSGQTPFGCDRLYCGADDRPKFVIHNLPSGLQEQRDYATGKLMATYGTVGKKSRNRFRKQRNEYSLLIPGDRVHRRVVRVIMYLRYVKGWRGVRIADYLNRRGVPSPKGKQWSQRQVEVIYENESYTGVSFNNQTYSGRFFRRDRDLGFVPLNRDECDLVVKKTFAPKLRPMDEWERIDQPYMYDFLPRHVRDLAIAAQARMWAERTDPTRPPKKPTAHPASDYLLSDRLRAVQDGETLVGTMSGPPHAKTPYYRHRRGKRGRLKGSVFNRLIPAQPLHEALAKLLAEVLTDVPDLRDRLTRHVEEQRAAAVQEEPQVARMEAERDELRRQIAGIVASLKGAALADVQSELTRLGERRNAVEAMLAKAREGGKRDPRPVEAVVEEALGVLAEDAKRLLTLPVEPLRDLVNRLVADATVDMETKAVEVAVNLPTWALLPRPKKPKTAEKAIAAGEEALCPALSSWSPVGGWTQEVFLLARCEYAWKRGSHFEPPCYRCRRSAA
jgi:hypothetical protein